MTTSQLRKLNVIIQRGMMNVNQTRLLVTLLQTPTTNLTELTTIYYGAGKQGEKNTMKMNYMKGYIKDLMLKFDFWGLPYIIVVRKDGTVTLREKPEGL